MSGGGSIIQRSNPQLADISAAFEAKYVLQRRFGATGAPRAEIH
jgi:hypothetical protein